MTEKLTAEEIERLRRLAKEAVEGFQSERFRGMTLKLSFYRDAVEDPRVVIKLCDMALATASRPAGEGGKDIHALLAEFDAADRAHVLPEVRHAQDQLVAWIRRHLAEAPRPAGEGEGLLKQAEARFAFLKPGLSRNPTTFGPADLEFEERLVAEIASLRERLEKAEKLRDQWFNVHTAHKEANEALGRANGELFKRAYEAERRDEASAARLAELRQAKLSVEEQNRRLVEENARFYADREAMRRAVEDGNRPLPFDRDTLGRMVREAWVRWAETQPTPKPSWLLPYDELPEPDKEADRQIGEAIARWTLIGDASTMSQALNAAQGEGREATTTQDASKCDSGGVVTPTAALQDALDALERSDGRLEAVLTEMRKRRPDYVKCAGIVGEWLLNDRKDTRAAHAKLREILDGGGDGGS